MNNIRPQYLLVFKEQTGRRILLTFIITLYGDKHNWFLNFFLGIKYFLFIKNFAKKFKH